MLYTKCSFFIKFFKALYLIFLGRLSSWHSPFPLVPPAKGGIFPERAAYRIWLMVIPFPVITKNIQ